MTISCDMFRNVHLSFSLCLRALSAVQPRDKGMIDLFCSTDRQSTFRCSNLITQNKREKMGGYGTELTRNGRKDTAWMEIKGMSDDGVLLFGFEKLRSKLRDVQ